MAAGHGTSSLTGVADDEWDAFLQNCPHSHHEQCSRYARNRAVHGFQYDRAVVRDHGAISGGAQILVQTSPIGKFAHVLRGPVAINDDPQLMRRVVRRLEEIAGERAYASIRVDLFPEQDMAYEALREVGFEPTLAWNRGMDSTLIPLSYSQEELLSLMNKKVRYYVRRASRNGVVARFGEEASLDDFFELHQKTASCQGFPTFPREYFAYLWNLFGKAEKVQYFVAHHDGAPIAAVYNTIVGTRMYFGWGGMRRDVEAKRMRVNHLLHMTAADWAREHGCSHYDLSGAQMFKRQFAIETIQWPWPLRKLYGPVRGLRWKLMELTGSSDMARRLVNKAARWCSITSNGDMPW